MIFFSLPSFLIIFLIKKNDSNIIVDILEIDFLLLGHSSKLWIFIGIIIIIITIIKYSHDIYHHFISENACCEKQIDDFCTSADDDGMNFVMNIHLDNRIMWKRDTKCLLQMAVHTVLPEWLFSIQFSEFIRCHGSSPWHWLYRLLPAVTRINFFLLFHIFNLLALPLCLFFEF